MAKVYLCADSQDEAYARKLGRGLRNAGCRVIFLMDGSAQAGEDTIEDCRAFVLIWSEAASRNEALASRWEEALAQNETLLVAALDQTPPGPALAYAPILEVKPMTGLVRSIMDRLLNPEQSETIDQELAETAPSGSPLMIWLTGIATVLTIFGLLLDLPGKVKKAFEKPKTTRAAKRGAIPPKPLVQMIGGAISNEDQQPLGGVTIVLPEFGKQTVSDENGTYLIQVKAPPQAPVRINFTHPDYKLKRMDVTAGNRNHNLVMRRKDDG